MANIYYAYTVIGILREHKADLCICHRVLL